MGNIKRKSIRGVVHDRGTGWDFGKMNEIKELFFRWVIEWIWKLYEGAVFYCQSWRSFLIDQGRKRRISKSFLTPVSSYSWYCSYGLKRENSEKIVQSSGRNWFLSQLKPRYFFMSRRKKNRRSRTNEPPLNSNIPIKASASSLAFSGLSSGLYISRVDNLSVSQIQAHYSIIVSEKSLTPLNKDRRMRNPENTN